MKNIITLALLSLSLVNVALASDCTVTDAKGGAQAFTLRLNQPGAFRGDSPNTLFFKTGSNLGMDSYCKAKEVKPAVFEGQIINSNGNCSLKLANSGAGVYTETYFSMSIGGKPTVTPFTVKCL